MELLQIAQAIRTNLSIAFNSTRRSVQSKLLSYILTNFFSTTNQKCLNSSIIRKVNHIILLALSTLMVISTTPVLATSVKEYGEIVKIQSMNELPIIYPQETIVFFDIDDTLFDSPYMLGSKSWRRYIVQATKGLDKNWHDILTLYLVNNLKVAAVEPVTAQVVLDLQAQGYGVSGLTARERNMWYTTPTIGVDAFTIEQLDAANIHFDNEAFQNAYPGLAQDKEYYAGVFFADTDLKGDYLRKIFANISSAERPKKIVFVDDKLNQNESVSSVLRELKIDHECYWYCATDAKAAKFSPLIANIQLYHLLASKQILSDQEAEVLAQEYPERDAAYYLQLILDSFESHA